MLSTTSPLNICRPNPVMLSATKDESLVDAYKTAMKWIPWDGENMTDYPVETVQITEGPFSITGIDPAISRVNIASPYIHGAAFACQRWSYGYYHFIAETLPKILRIVELDQKVPLICYYANFHPKINIQFIPEVLKYFGIINPIINYHPGVVYTVQHLMTTTDVQCGIPSPHDVAIIRAHLPMRAETPPPKNVGIVIKRSGRPLRSIWNHADMYDAICAARPDLEWHEFDSMPFADTVELFSRAKVIVAPHGAGLVNMLWTAPGARIIEIGPVNEPNICYWHLSCLLGHNHTILVAPSDASGRLWPQIDKIIESIR